MWKESMHSLTFHPLQADLKKEPPDAGDKSPYPSKGSPKSRSDIDDINKNSTDGGDDNDVDYNFSGESSTDIISVESSDDMNTEGFTALHIAIRSKQIGIVQILLQNGADLHIEAKNGDAPMDLALALSSDDASECGQEFKEEFIKLLQEFGARHVDEEE